MANCPHTIGVEFGTRIIEVAGQKVFFFFLINYCLSILKLIPFSICFLTDKATNMVRLTNLYLRVTGDLNINFDFHSFLKFKKGHSRTGEISSRNVRQYEIFCDSFIFIIHSIFLF